MVEGAHLHAEGAPRAVRGSGARYQDVAAVPVHVHEPNVQDADAVHVGDREAGGAHLQGGPCERGANPAGGCGGVRSAVLRSAHA